MSTLTPIANLAANKTHDPARPTPAWVHYATLCWSHRSFVVRATALSFAASLAIACALPKRYSATARIMPPTNSAASTAMLAALAGRALGGFTGLTSMAGNLLGGYNASAVLVDLLHSGTIADHLVTRYDLQHVYGKRYRSDAAKALAHHTKVADDKRSGAITITVQDHDPQRARDLAQGYLDELNLLVIHASTSSAHQERAFIEQRLVGVKSQLSSAQQRLSEFSSTHATVDIKEQTRAMVDAASRLEAERTVEQASLQSLRQVYGEENVRVRSTQARLAVLDAQLGRMTGSSAPLPSESQPADTGAKTTTYPALRQLPRLAVPYADLYREVQVNEAVFDLLTQQYELARIQEARDIPVITVIDAPGVPDKKSFPPRLLLTIALTLLFTGFTFAYLLLSQRWARLSAEDPGKQFVATLSEAVRQRTRRQVGAL